MRSNRATSYHYAPMCGGDNGIHLNKIQRNVQQLPPPLALPIPFPSVNLRLTIMQTSTPSASSTSAPSSSSSSPASSPIFKCWIDQWNLERLPALVRSDALARFRRQDRCESFLDIVSEDGFHRVYPEWVEHRTPLHCDVPVTCIPIDQWRIVVDATLWIREPIPATHLPRLHRCAAVRVDRHQFHRGSPVTLCVEHREGTPYDLFFEVIGSLEQWTIQRELAEWLQCLTKAALP